MLHIPASFAQGGASAGGGVDFAFYIVLIVLLTIVTVVMKTVFARRAASSTASVAVDDSLAIRIAPAPPFPDDVARLRAAIGETSPEPRITRYTVPVVTVEARELTIRDKKAGRIISIPLADIASVTAGAAPIKPKGTFITRTYPSLWVTVRIEGSELAVALTPIVGAYDKVRQSEVESMAAQINARLAAART